MNSSSVLPPSGWRAAIIDLDGTMVDTQGDFVVALNLTLTELAPLLQKAGR